MKMDVITMSRMPGTALKRDRLGRLGRAFCGRFGGPGGRGLACRRGTGASRAGREPAEGRHPVLGVCPDVQSRRRGLRGGTGNSST